MSDATNPQSTVERRFVTEQGFAGEIAAIAEPVIEELGFRLVRVVVSGRDGGTIQIMADHGTREINVDDCADISRALLPVLDAYAGEVRANYGVEISSPGIDRPLVRPSDIERFAGLEAKIETRELVDGRKRFRGHLEGLEEGEARLVVSDIEGGPQVLGFPLEMIESAKLVLTDELIRGSLRAAKHQENDAGTIDPGETDNGQ